MEFFACYKQATPLGFLLATFDGAKRVPLLKGRGIPFGFSD